MPNLATDLARVMGLLEKATPGKWRKAIGWVRDEHGTKLIDCGQYTTLDDDGEAIAAAINFLRQHGPEIAETFKETPNG